MPTATSTPTAKVKAAKASTPAKPATKAKRVMSDSHKESLAQGRTNSRIVASYLEAQAKGKKKRGRQVTVESLTAKLEKAEASMLTASVLERLNLTQQMRDTKAALAELQASPTVDIETLEKDFIRVAKSYADTKGITRQSFIDNGVAKSVLVAAGI